MSISLDFQPLLPYASQFANGAWLTLRLSISAMAIGTAIAILGAWIRVQGPKYLAHAIGIYVEAIRNTPLLIQIYLVFFALPGLGLRLSADSAALVALTLNVAAYATEIIRAGIESVPKGLHEAGRALGLRTGQVFVFITLRPALRSIFPALASQFILLMLFSSLVSVISANDLASVANHVQSATFRSFEVYFVSTLIYFSIAVSLSFIFDLMFKRLVDYPVR